MMRTLLLIGLMAIAISTATADNWPAWRGPLANGQCRETNLPVSWSPTENIRWKVPLPGPGNSTPIIWGDRIFLTQSIDAAGTQRAVMCLDRKDGSLLWQHVMAYKDKETTHADNPYCSASPVTDGAVVVAWLGSAGVVCLDLAGKPLWQLDVGKFEHIWGNASSPVIYKDMVLLNCGPGERTFLLALDKRTGKEMWRVEEPGKFGNAPADWMGSWSTPIVARIGDRDEVIVSWPDAVKSYDPANGKLIWQCRGTGKLVYTSPLVSPEVIVAMSGYGGPYLAVRTGGSGDVTETHRLWWVERARQRIGSGVIIGEHVYILNEPGTMECIELKTGKTLWNERIGGSSWGTLVHADGKLYVTNLQGETFVLAAKPELQVLSQNNLAERTLSSIAISNSEIFVRTYQHLWCVRGK